MMYLKSLLISCLCLVGHKFYVSTVQLNYKAETSKLEVILQIFTDDLDLAIQEEIDADFSMEYQPPSGAVSPNLAAYVRKHWSVETDHSPLEINFIGYESDYDLTKIYYEIQLPQELNRLDFKNTILLRQFEDQKNLMHFKAERQRKSFLLNARETTFSIKFPIEF